MTSLRSLLLVAGLIGCGAPHLAPDTGVAYRGALADQRGTTGDGPEATADDARQTLRVRRGEESEGERASEPLAIPAPILGGTGGQWPGASGNIRLEAK